MEQTLEYILPTSEPPSPDASARVPCSFSLHIALCISLQTILSTEGTNRVCFVFQDLNELLTFQCRSTHTKPIQVHDATTRQGAKVCVSLDADHSDNPMQSESACHVGAKGNHSCRKCNNGGTTTEKELDTGYHQLFFVCSISLCDDTLLANHSHRLGNLVPQLKPFRFCNSKSCSPAVVCVRQLRHYKHPLGSRTPSPSIGLRTF